MKKTITTLLIAILSGCASSIPLTTADFDKADVVCMKHGGTKNVDATNALAECKSGVTFSYDIERTKAATEEREKNSQKVKEASVMTALYATALYALYAFLLTF